MASTTSRRISDVIDLTADSPKKRQKQFDRSSRFSLSQIRPVILLALTLYPEYQVLLETLRPSTIDELNYDGQVTLLNTIASAKDDIAALILSTLNSIPYIPPKDETFESDIEIALENISDFAGRNDCPDQEQIMEPLCELMRDITAIATKTGATKGTIENAFRAQFAILQFFGMYGLEVEDSDYIEAIDITINELWEDAMTDDLRLSLAPVADKIASFLGEFENADCFQASLDEFRDPEREKEDSEEEDGSDEE